MSLKAFLLEECENVRDLLNRTLRHDYGLSGSAEFYQECAARLDFLNSELQAVAETDLQTLATFSRAINELSKLICRIERSSIGEYSWPFVEELKNIASSICTEHTIDDPNLPLKVYVLADGGLDSYGIYAERRRPSYAKRRLLTIVFPKTLKHFVLLHSILGHEIGHAIWQCTKHENVLKNEVLSHLLHTGGQFESGSSTANWIFSPTAPPAIRAFLATQPSATAANLFTSFCNWEAWVEEMLCDTIGLLTFGPSFIAAECRMLYGLDPSGMALAPQHPFVGWRVNLLRRGARLLGMDSLPEQDSVLKGDMKEFWDYIDTFVQPDPWFNILTDAELLAALQGLERLLATHAPALYTSPTFERLEKLTAQLLNLTPPVGFEITDNYELKCENIDFRHILYAGWIASRRNSGSALPFKRVNELCEHAIMQQRSIAISLKVAAP